MEAKMHATAKSLRICAKDLERWLKRVLESWELHWHNFRLLDGPAPSFGKCTELHDTFITNQSTMASLAQRMKGEILQELKGHSSENSKGGRGSKNKLNVGKPGGASKPSNQQTNPNGGGSDADHAEGSKPGGKGKKKRRKEGPSAWPDMPKLNKEDYTSFRKEVADAFPDGCIFFLASRCSKGSECQRPHEVPEGYDTIKAKYTQL